MNHEYSHTLFSHTSQYSGSVYTKNINTIIEKDGLKVF